MVRFIVYKIKFCLGLYSRDGSSYNLSNIILYFQYRIDSTLNSKDIDTFLSPSVENTPMTTSFQYSMVYFL